MRLDGLYGNEALKARLSAAFDSGRVAHSYLLCGPDGSGKHTLARSMAAAMQCTGRGELPCGVCTACRKVLSGQHPDVITVNDPEHKLIAVDVIRRMRADMFVRPNEGARKIYILDQDMGEPSQNALLKILEEPPDYGVFLILTANAEKLLATIRSRCALKLSPLTPEEALPALRKQFPERPDEELRAALPAGGRLSRTGRRAADRGSERAHGRIRGGICRAGIRWACSACCCRWKSSGATSSRRSLSSGGRCWPTRWPRRAVCLRRSR